MNPYKFPVICAICGGEGLGTIDTAVHSWIGDSVHKNPNVCRENLARKAKELLLRDLANTPNVQDGEGI